MDQNLLKEIQYLTHLIEHHKRNSSEKSCYMETSLLNHYLGLTRFNKMSKTSSCTPCNELPSTNVYINPNFKPQTSAIHINPKLRMKSLVHINPKIMNKVINSNESVQSSPVNVTTNVKQNPVQEENVKKSVYVNPKLMKKLSSSTQSKPTEKKEIPMPNIPHSVCSRLKFVKSTNSSKMTHSQKRTNNSNIVILSRRKLVRVKRGSRRSSSASQRDLYKIKKSPNSMLKCGKPASQRTIKTKIINALQQSIDKDSNFVKSVIKPKINKYRIDRTTPRITSTKKHTGLEQKKNVNIKMQLITIGGIVYKSSKNQLVRNSYGGMRKRTANTKTDKFIVATNGKKLCRVKSMKEASGNFTMKTISGTKLLTNISQKVNYKNNISNKVKQKSIQILRNKMQKNNQPCLIFQRFGYCSNHEKGVCLKRHDKKQISLCKKFLQGNCLLDKCPLSHDVGPEKMPTCKYFLDGCCTRDGCPYRHIKVSSSTPICIEFLQGYCAKGHKCKQRHENLCPEFAKTGKCSKGKHCPYPHKPQLSSNKQSYLKRKHNVAKNQITQSVSKDIPSPNNDNRIRYYEQPDSLSKSFDKKKENILKKVKLMKKLETAAHSDTLIEISNDNSHLESIEDNCESQVPSDLKILKRPPIGSLPAYIPID